VNWEKPGTCATGGGIKFSIAGPGGVAVVPLIASQVVPAPRAKATSTMSGIESRDWGTGAVVFRGRFAIRKATTRLD
jgi:hypothetical protein